MANTRGITLIELIIVISIIGVLVVALGFSFQGWVAGYRVEVQTKEMYADLMNARARAMSRNRAHFVTLTTTSYTVYDDTNPLPDGNGTLETAGTPDTQLLAKTLDSTYPITWNDLLDTEIEFTARGLSNDDKTICSNSSADADYNCIIISTSRINIGKLTTKITSGGICGGTPNNCVAK